MSFLDDFFNDPEVMSARSHTVSLLDMSPESKVVGVFAGSTFKVQTTEDRLPKRYDDGNYKYALVLHIVFVEARGGVEYYLSEGQEPKIGDTATVQLNSALSQRAWYETVDTHKIKPFDLIGVGYERQGRTAVHL